MARPPAYSTIGRYKHGFWLVSKNGSGAIVNHKNLPPQGSGFKYYWLGTTRNQVELNTMTAINKLGVRTDQIGLNIPNTIDQARRTGKAQFGKAPSGILGAIKSALEGGVFVPGPVSGGAGGTGGAAAAEGAGVAGADAAAGGTGLGTAAITAAAITDPLDFLKLVAWIFHPRNILRTVEFLVGILAMGFGLHAAMQFRGERLEGFSTSEAALTRSGLGRVATELGRAAKGGGGGKSGHRPQRPQSAPHATRRRALRQRYQREEDLQRRRASNPRPRKP